MVFFNINIHGLKSNKGFLCGSDDPFFYIERARSENQDEFLKVIQSEPVRKSLNPTWTNQMYAAKEISNGDLDCPLRFKVYSWRNSGYHKFFGEMQTSLTNIKRGQTVYSLADSSGNDIGSQFEFSNFRFKFCFGRNKIR